MKLSTRATYGLRALMALATEEEAGPVMLKGLAERHALPPTYLEQLMVPLRKSGLVAATRGARGGYRLGRPAEEITVLEIVEVLDGRLTFIDCHDITCCNMAPDSCALKSLLDEASASARRILGDVTLATLVQRQQDRNDNPSLMYMI